MATGRTAKKFRIAAGNASVSGAQGSHSATTSATRLPRSTLPLANRHSSTSVGNAGAGATGSASSANLSDGWAPGSREAFASRPANAV